MFSFIKFTPLIVCALLFVLVYTQAFCIYNGVDAGGPSFDISVQPETSSSFHKNVAPGEAECCDWKDGNCNNIGYEDSPLLFKVRFGDYEKYFSSEAGGTIVFTGASVDYIQCTLTRTGGLQNNFHLNLP